jgi:hypothetical protein
MRKAILTLAGSAALGVLALTGLQGAAAQAHEYRRHEIRYYHRDHHRDHGWYWRYRYDRDHFRR